MIKIIRGQTWVISVQKRSNRASWSKYIKYAYVSTHNFVRDWNSKLFQIKLGHKNYQRSNLGQSCETGSFRTVWSNCIQYTYVQTPKLFLFSILSRFWNRREKDGALMVFSQKDTRVSNVWPTKVCEGAESREAYAWRLTFDPPEFLFVINDHVTQFVRKPTFDPLSKWSKTHFWSSSN